MAYYTFASFKMRKPTLVATFLVLIHVGIGAEPLSSGSLDEHIRDKRFAQWAASFIDSSDDGEPDIDDVITVKTTDINNAGTSGRVFMVFTDDKGRTSREICLPSDWFARSFGEFVDSQTFTRNSDQRFENIRRANGLSNISSLEIWQSPAAFSLENDWKPELVTLLQKPSNSVAYFPIDRWLKPNVHYFFGKYDAFLPQKDPFPKQRENDLAIQRRVYQYTHNGPYKKTIKVKLVPPDEAFSIPVFYDLIGDNAVPILLSKVKKMGKQTWKSYDDIFSIYDSSQFTVPLYASYDFRSDVWFGQQRLQGIDPGLIRLINEIPNNFAVNPRVVKKIIKTMSLEKALKMNKIFIVDLEINRPLKEKLNVEIAAPLALFYLNKDGDLVPIAIQLFQDKGPDNPVFYPSDNKNLWLLVKMYYNHAEAAHHQSISHFARTHSLMEAVAVCTQRTLAPNHPVYRILKPHFIYTFAINKLVGPLLTTPGGLIDSTMTIGHEGLLFFNNLGLATYNMTRDGFVIDKFKEQRVTKKILPYYPYRDDISMCYNIIRKYVSSVVKIYYKNKQDLKGDVELLEWRRQLSGTPETFKGIGIAGVPGDDEKGFQTIEELIDVITIFINTASGIHSTVNFLQYEWYGFPPNYAAYLKGPIPTRKRKYTEREVLDYLPRRSKLSDILMLARYLVTKSTNFLGDFEVPMLYHPKAMKAVKIFQEDIESVSKKIQKLNEKRKQPYIWGDPKTFPNAVNV